MESLGLQALSYGSTNCCHKCVATKYASSALRYTNAAETAPAFDAANARDTAAFVRWLTYLQRAAVVRK